MIVFSSEYVVFESICSRCAPCLARVSASSLPLRPQWAVVFLTDALSVLQSIKSNKDKEQHSLFTKLTDLSKRYNTTLL